MHKGDAPAWGWYRPPQTIKRFHSSQAFVRWLIGGRGSSKTTGCFGEAIRHGWQNPGGRIICFRKTETSQETTSVETFKKCFEQMGTLYQSSEKRLTLFECKKGGLEFRIPSEKAAKLFVDFLKRSPTQKEIMHWHRTIGDKYCSRIIFKGLKDKKLSERVLRGMECSMLIMIEADQLQKEDFDLAMACVRWKDADGQAIPDRCIIVDTNPPDLAHWIPAIETEWKEGKHPDYEFFHLRTDENAHNLPEGYVANLKATYSNNLAMYERMINGNYANAYSGKPVYWSFSARNKAKELSWPKGAYLIRGWDFGVRMAVSWNAYFSQEFAGKTYEYWWILKELCLEGIDTDRACPMVLDITEEEFPFWNDRSICSGVSDYCDKAGNNRQSARGLSDVMIMRTHGIMPGWKNNITLVKSIALINRLLSANDPTGAPLFQIDSEYCPTLISAFEGKYRYPSQGDPGYNGDKSDPLKGDLCGHTDHVCFVAGTQIEMESGEKPIETIRVGEYAWTRQGLRKVVATGNRLAVVKDYEFSNGTSVTCTPDHPFWSESQKKMIPIDLLTRKDTMSEWNLKRENLMGRFIGGILNRIEGVIGYTSKAIQHFCITQFGENILAKSRLDITFITSMGIQAITKYPIWNVYRQRSTSKGITRRSEERSQLSSSTESGIWRSSGTNRRRGLNGTQSMLGNSVLEQKLLLKGNVMNAVNLSNPKSRRELPLGSDSAPTNANLNSEENQGWMMWKGFALIAEYLSKLINIGIRPIVLVNAVDHGERRMVYNITVEGEHEYYANGLLVSNCDSVRYPIMNAMRLTVTEAERPIAKVGAMAKKSPTARKLNDMYHSRASVYRG
jgi:hypothetical protein